MTITIRPTGKNQFEVTTFKKTIKNLTWDEVLGRLAILNLNELDAETTIKIYPETITIANNEGYYEVIHKGEITKHLCWDEMLGQVVNLIHPQLKKPWFTTQQIKLLPYATR
ncbi:MAG: hypothetical protein VKL42_12520 [Snowella sp.]|nr:hypothetical protein [Snowella sp.]